MTIFFLNIFSVGSFAQTSSVYTPPKGKVREQNRKAGGTRGCRIPLEDTVTLLVPQDHIASTTLPYPTFFWHVPSQLSLPLRFTLIEPGKPTIFIRELKPQSGIVALKLPQNSKPLEVGKTYRWTVTVLCNRTKPSRNLFAQAWIQRVSLANNNSEVSNELSCNQYAEEGVWYDALSCFYTTQSENMNEEFWSLLTEINLNFITVKTYNNLNY